MKATDTKSLRDPTRKSCARCFADRMPCSLARAYFHLAAGWRQPGDVSSLVDRGRIVAESLCSGTKGYMGLKVVDRRKLLGGIERISQV